MRSIAESTTEVSLPKVRIIEQEDRQAMQLLQAQAQKISELAGQGGSTKSHATSH
ncbi:hypothetical protein M378DRAFT_172092 [Amanita muscaria Koide BX008]|uniref:Uncharacterized protein n=1 Tax=Amanita muscaria (strain Koide BX008) TaxID=946122 RepID=A0A0C2S3B3_AMAMK|nr:hypothetical protein M378DRAFT_172092 [Amanita muscaria Koide BX008]